MWDLTGRNAMAASATLHCLTGCAVGEVLGLLVGTAVGLSNAATIALAVALAFLFGSVNTKTICVALAGFMIGGLLVSVAAQLEDTDELHADVATLTS